MLKLVICSHRGPVRYASADAGLRALASGPGGLVTAVAAAARCFDSTWLYAASTEGDREIARRYPRGIVVSGLKLKILDLPEREHRSHYEQISSALLAPLFHYMFSLTYAPMFTGADLGAWQGYQRVNDIFGESAASLRGHDAVLVEDAQLMLLGSALRSQRRAPDVPLAYFHHIPWCEPSYFGVLPAWLRTQILQAMLAYDSCAFHCRKWADAFMACCERFLSGAARSGSRIEWRGRSTDVAVLPASIDAQAVREALTCRDAGGWRTEFEKLKRDRLLIVRVERADPAKNAIRGLRAFEMLLAADPPLRKASRLLAVITPVRGWVSEYRSYFAAIQATADEINARFRDDAGGEVVSLSVANDPHEPDRTRALAALAAADVHVVNPTFDGLNLVAMEGAIAGDAALVLSENAGAHELLGHAALSINPFDVEGTADAMRRALGWSGAERFRQAALVRSIVESHTPGQWMAQRVERCAPESSVGSLALGGRTQSDLV